MDEFRALRPQNPGMFCISFITESANFKQLFHHEGRLTGKNSSHPAQYAWHFRTWTRFGV
jgi:hypothetical protein